MIISATTASSHHYNITNCCGYLPWSLIVATDKNFKTSLIVDINKRLNGVKEELTTSYHHHNFNSCYFHIILQSSSVPQCLY